MKNGNINNLNSPAKGFEEVKQIDENGVEFWSARDLFPLLGYSRWEDFDNVINKAKKSCFKSGQNIEDHFRDLAKMAQLGSGSKRSIKDYKLDRYACYLIAQNGDSRIQQIALAQTYFAIQTRKIEVHQNEILAQAEKRIFIRGQVRKENKKLFSTAKKSGVNNFGQFNDAGYWGLYGMPLAEIEKKKNLKKGELLDKVGGKIRQTIKDIQGKHYQKI
jgi:DNA-damage-inducible protein D